MDPDGVTALVSVPLTNTDKTVVLYQEDFNDLIRSGLSPLWRLMQGQVLERGRARVSISRLVKNAKAGQKIYFIDKDPCNLRRSNLLTAIGCSKSKTRDKLKNRPRSSFLKERVELKHIYIKPSYAA